MKKAWKKPEKSSVNQLAFNQASKWLRDLCKLVFLYLPPTSKGGLECACVGGKGLPPPPPPPPHFPAEIQEGGLCPGLLIFPRASNYHKNRISKVSVYWPYPVRVWLQWASVRAATRRRSGFSNSACGSFQVQMPACPIQPYKRKI
jgi:hypothetical protein